MTTDMQTVTYDVAPQRVAEFFLEVDSTREEPDVTQLKLQKLLYFAQANYLAFTGHRLFNEPIQAWEHGPVVNSMYHQYKGYGKQTIAAAGAHGEVTPRPHTGEDLPADVAEFLTEVWKRYGHYSASELRNMSHRDNPWCKHYYPGSYQVVIPDEEMAEHYRYHVPESRKVLHSGVAAITSEELARLEDEDDDAFVQSWLEALAR